MAKCRRSEPLDSDPGAPGVPGPERCPCAALCLRILPAPARTHCPPRLGSSTPLFPSGAALQCPRGCWWPKQDSSNSPGYRCKAFIVLYVDLWTLGCWDEGTSASRSWKSESYLVTRSCYWVTTKVQTSVCGPTWLVEILLFLLLLFSLLQRKFTVIHSSQLLLVGRHFGRWEDADKSWSSSIRASWHYNWGLAKLLPFRV